MRGWKRQESGMGMPAKSCDQREKKSRRKENSEDQGRKRAGETQLIQLPVPISCSQPSARGALLHRTVPYSPDSSTSPGAWFSRAQRAWNSFLSSPSLAWGFRNEGTTAVQPLLSWEGFSPRKSAVSPRLEVLRPPLCSTQMAVCRTSQERPQTAYLQASDGQPCVINCAAPEARNMNNKGYTDFIMKRPF